MPRIFAATLIRQPAELVFEYVTTPGNWPRWHPWSLAVSGATNHSLHVGEQVTEEFLVAGRLGRAIWTVVERQEPMRWTIDGEIVGQAHRSRIVYTLGPHGDGATVFEHELFYRVANPLQRIADALFLRQQIQRESSDAVRRLQFRLEGLGESWPVPHGTV